MVSQKVSEEGSKFDPWGWLTPFDTYVWILIIVTIFFSSFVYWTLEQLDPTSDSRDERLDAYETTWLFATAFTGQFDFAPQTNAARLFTFSVSFWALLIGAAYTANLASFLVVRNQPKVEINTIDQAVQMNVKMCISGSTGADVAVSNAYPNANLIRTDNAGVYEGVNNGDCLIAITTVSSWESYQYDETVNGDCNLAYIGRIWSDVPAGFATWADSGRYCTSLLRDVINLEMSRLKENGFLADAWAEHTQKTGTLTIYETGDYATLSY
jgi:hypothetical protein